MWGGIFQQAVSLTGTFNPWLLLAIFAITLVAEFGLSIPFLMETIWLLVGYQVGAGELSPDVVVLFCFISLTGREIGAGMLYKVSGFGYTPFSRLMAKLDKWRAEEQEVISRWKKHFLRPLADRISKLFISHRIDSETETCKSTRRILRISPFHVAMGRFLCLKIPLTITMGITRQLFILLLGVGLFSLVWDGLYIVIGLFGAGRGLSPNHMLLYTLGGFLMVNILVFSLRRAFRAYRPVNSDSLS